jgi:hypothetical protein
LVLQVLRPLWAAKIVTGQVLQRRLAAVFKFACATKYRSCRKPTATRKSIT